MHFLVTGGAGFIGSALTQRLIRDGHQVIVLDDLSGGGQRPSTPTIQFVQGDVNNIPLLWSLLAQVDCVYHLAARVSVAQSILHPQEYNQVNVGGTVSLMEAMRDTGVRRVVFASSGAAYGRQPQQPVHEDDTPQPDSPYAVSKWAAEQYIHTIGNLWHIETVALRIFNAYGPGQQLPISHAPVIPRYLQQILTGGSVVLYNNGQQSRDFVYVDDVVNALVTAATATNINRQVINIGSGVETSIADLVSAMEQVLKRKAHRIHAPERGGGVPRLVADTTKARRLLGFQPFTPLATGLAQTVERDGRFTP